MDQPSNVIRDATHAPSSTPQMDQPSDATSDTAHTPSPTPQMDQCSNATSNTTRQKAIPLWTVMVYFAVDDPGQPGMNILQQLKQVGSTDQVTILAHCDPEGVGRPKSYYLQKGTRLDEDIRFRYTHPPNDPAAFGEFVKWGLKDHAATHYLLIIWGHGDGWQALDVALHVPGRSGQTRLQPQDMLDCEALKQALEAALADQEVLASNLHRPTVQVADKKRIKLDILGMDSCLMAMAEVGYELRQSVDYLIACEEVEPVSSWPYDYIFEDLAQYYDKLSPLKLAKLIVRKYIISYKERMIDVTQSVLDLRQAEGLRDGVCKLADALMKAYDCPLLRDAMMISRAQVQRYFETDYVDLYDFCRILIEESEYASGLRVSSDTERASLLGLASVLKDACRELQTIIRGKERRYSSSDASGVSKDHDCFAPVHGLYGFTVRNSYGVSIYFPCRDSSDAYDNLDFAKATGWGQFLARFAPKRPQRPGVSSGTVAESQLVRIGDETAMMGHIVGSGDEGPALVEPMVFPYDPIARFRARDLTDSRRIPNAVTQV
jgi:hypothetical protein